MPQHIPPSIAARMPVLTNEERTYLARLVREDMTKLGPALELEQRLDSPHVNMLKLTIAKLGALAIRLQP